MIVDSSALLAIILGESDADAYLSALRRSSEHLISAANYLEVAIVSDARISPDPDDLDALLSELRIAVVPVTLAQARIAREAYRRFGRGNHAAGLNYGDCFAYALARETDRPLLYKGEDFARTDVAAAL